jgi:hypothetical protein
MSSKTCCYNGFGNRKIFMHILMSCDFYYTSDKIPVSRGTKPKKPAKFVNSSAQLFLAFGVSFEKRMFRSG